MASPPRINSYCIDKGWLFQDLQRSFAEAGAVATEKPVAEADRWMCIRSSELGAAPDIARTIVQVHNMEPHDIDLFNAARGVVFTHPMQVLLWEKAGFVGRSMLRPIGARRVVRPAATLLPRPTVGFFTGENRALWKGSDRFARVVDRLRPRLDFDVLMIGRKLDWIERLGRYERAAAAPQDYARIDVLFCASISPGVPLSVYEACAAGVPVVTTPRWFPQGRWPGVTTGHDDASLATALERALRDRVRAARKRPGRAVAPYLYEHWIAAAMRFCHAP